MIEGEVKSLFGAIGQALTLLSQEVEDLGLALCSDPRIAGPHIHELQALDRIAQKQRALAALLDADCPLSALGDIAIEDLARQLHTARTSTNSELEDFTLRAG